MADPDEAAPVDVDKELDEALASTRYEALEDQSPVGKSGIPDTVYRTKTSGSNKPILKISGLSKHYHLTRLGKRTGRIDAVKELDLEVPQGSIFGFLGPNGAGKTTTIQCACGLLQPETGSIEVAGQDMVTSPTQAKANLGYLPEVVGLYPQLNAMQTLAYYGSFYDLDRSHIRKRGTELLELFGLADRAAENVGGYSLGMRKRLALAAALLHGPQVLVLDEPTSGLDPQGVRALRQVLRDLNAAGLTIFFSSHVLSEVSQICDHVAILNQGQLVASGTLEELQGRLTGMKAQLEVQIRNLTPPLETELKALPEVELLQVRPLTEGLFGLDLTLSQDITPVINQILVEHKALVYKLNLREDSLEELFMAFTGIEGGEAVVEARDPKGGGPLG